MRDKENAVCWHPGEMVGHELAEGLRLKVERVLPDGEHVKALVVRRGETGLWEGHVLTFRAKYLTPVGG